jgi:hypothetical protein
MEDAGAIGGWNQGRGAFPVNRSFVDGGSEQVWVDVGIGMGIKIRTPRLRGAQRSLSERSLTTKAY